MLKLLLLLNLAFIASAALVGSNRCTWGPSYWCKSFAAADECKTTDHCMKNVWNKPKTKAVGVTTKDNDACVFCKDMVTDVRNLLSSNETRETILSYIGKMCGFMPDDFSKNECQKIETHYLDAFIQLVKDNVDPDQICSLIGLCTSQRTNQLHKASVFKAAALVPAKKLVRVSLTKDSSLKSGNFIECEICKKFMSIAHQKVQDPNNQKIIKNDLMQGCQQLGGDLPAKCQKFVTMIFPTLVTLAGQEVDQACVLLKICDSSSYADVASLAQASLKKWYTTSLKSAMHQIAVNDQECDNCEMMVGYVRMFLLNNNTESSLETIIDTKICAQLGELSQTCDSLIQQYLPVLYSKLLDFVDPKTLCTELGLCKSAVQKPAEVKPVRVKSSATCVVCEFVMNKLDSMLSDNATESEIISAVEKVCSILPSSVKSECDDLVEKYGKAIISLLVNDVSPATVCSFLGLCSSGDSRYKIKLRYNEETCQMCEFALSYLKSLLSENATEAEIMHAVEKLCNYLSGKMAQECNGMVEVYGPQLIKFADQMVNPQQMCTSLGLCKSKARAAPDGLVHLFNRVSNV